MLCGEGETVVMLASENAFDLAPVLGAQWASNNDTVVRSQRGAGLRKHSPGSSRTLFVVVLANKTTNCQEKFCKQNTGTRGACGLFKKWFPTWSEGFFLPVCSLLMFLILILIGEKLPGIFCVWSRLPVSSSPRVNEWRNVQVTSPLELPFFTSLLHPGI